MAVDPSQIAPAFAPQLNLTTNETGRLAIRIEEDFRNAISDHDARLRRFTRYYQRWRARADPATVGASEASNVRVPLVQWQVYGKLAKEMAQLLGTDAEVIAKPVGPSDQKKVKKISRYMTWLVFDAMRLPTAINTFDFRRILNGVAHAYTPWKRDTFYVPSVDGKQLEDVAYEGPGFEPLWPDDIIVPAEDVTNIQEFSYVIRKYRITPDQLLTGEEQGRYQGIKDNFQTLVDWATHKRARDFESELIKQEKDLAEGVTYEGSMSGANVIIVHEWHGRWRKLKGKQDGRENNLERRESHESELMVSYIPELHMIIGAQDLMQMYPRSPDRRPFVEGRLVNDGSYWSPGFGELLETIEDELSVNHNIMTEAGQFSVGPLVFYKPGQGFDPANFVYSPGQAIATENPDLVKVVQFPVNLEYIQVKENSLITMAERVTGITDMNIGRSQEQPNAPRTARGTLALLSEGDVRAELETNALREDWGKILSKFWTLATMFAPESEFFRVTEEDADGLFDVKNGGAWMTSEERGDRYDFDIRFATNAWSRETNKQDALALYQIDLTNPLINTNPQALWACMDRVHRAFGDDNFSDIVPQPPPADVPIDPVRENAMIQEGQEVTVNPQDNDQQHIVVHSKLIDELGADPDANETELNALVQHRLQHVDQIARKQIMQQLASIVAGQMQAKIQAGIAGGGQPGAEPAPGTPPGAPGGQIPPVASPGDPSPQSAQAAPLFTPGGPVARPVDTARPGSGIGSDAPGARP